MEFDNYFKLEIDAKNVNESFARGVVAMFCTELKPTISEINDIKTAVSEAVTNSIVHGYNNNGGKISIEAGLKERLLDIELEQKNGAAYYSVDELDAALKRILGRE